MKAVVVDTNVLFSALRMPESELRTTLLNEECRFYVPNFLVVEIIKHREKMMSHTKESETETIAFLAEMMHLVHLVNENLVSTANIIQAHRLCKDVDENDTPFVALALELDAELWTGDKKLKQGLKKKGFHRFFEPDSKP